MSNLLSKVSIGGTVYDIKDAYARTEIGKLGTAALKDYASSITAGGTGLPDAGTIKSYVDSQIESIPTFEAVVCEADATKIPAGAVYKAGSTVITGTMAASATTYKKIYLVKNSDAGAGAHIEYITIRSGTEGSYTYAWEQIGTTVIDLSGYVPTSRTIAGLALSADIAKGSLQTALDLGAMAYAATASGTVEGQTITGVKATGTTTGSLTGDIAFDSTAISSTGKFTPSGSVAGTVTATGTVTMAAATGSEGIQVSGTVAAPTVSVTLTKADEVLGSIKDAAVAPTFTEGAFTAATLTYSNTNQYATEGLTAAMDTTDTEMLVFSAASKSAASVISAFDGGSKAADTFTAGSAATFNTKNVVSGVESATATAPEFTGGRIKATFAGNSSGDAIDASFTGSEGNLSVSGNYDKAKKGTLAFTGASVELAVGDIAVSAKSVTVSPDTPA